MRRVIGKWVEGGKPAHIDWEVLLASRMLICANSGGGKSYMLRGVIEAHAGVMQQILIDTDGEFASLREKFDFVICAPKGGDAIAHPNTAALLCRRLLETRVSAIIDISELKVPDRHLFVKRFIEELMVLPRDLWGSTLVYLDEGHIYCPEKGQGESIAADAVIDLASRGRKRGYCLVVATQRLAKFRKDAAAELLNRLIGRTSLDIDVKRAAFELGMTPKDAQAILPHMEPGRFFAYGPAIAKEVAMMQGIQVATSHPKPGAARVKSLPKPTAAIMSVLPQLADLPKEAEEEAKTLQDMRRSLDLKNQELRTLTRELERAKKVPSQKADPAKVAELKALVRQQRSVVEAIMKFVVKVTMFGYDDKGGAEITKALESALLSVSMKVQSAMDTNERKLEALQTDAASIIKRAQALLDQKVELEVEVRPQPVTRVEVREPRQHVVSEAAVTAEGLSKPQQGILDALAWLSHKGIEQASRPMVSAICKRRGGAFNNNVSALKTAGYLHYPNNLLALTVQGGAAANPPHDDGRELWEHWMDVLTNPQRDILKAMVEAGAAVSRDDLSMKVGRSGGAFNNNVSAMATMGALYYPQKGWVALTKNVIP